MRPAAWWSVPQIRNNVLQGVALLLLAWLVWSMMANASANMPQLGDSPGYSFMDNRAGFAVPDSLVPFTPDNSYWRVFLLGLVNTLILSGLAMVTAVLLGIAVGVGRLSTNFLLRNICTVYVEIARNIPLLLQAFFWYFAVLRTLPTPRDAIPFGFGFGDIGFLSNRGLVVPAPIMEGLFWLTPAIFLVATIACWFTARWAGKRRMETGQSFPILRVAAALLVVPATVVFIATGMPLAFEVPEKGPFNFRGGATVVPELVAMWLALSVYTAAFIGEAVRGGILAVSHGQAEAALALGLKRSQLLRLVVLPQALRVIVPPVTNQLISLVKNSSLGAAIAYPELMNVAGTTFNKTGQTPKVLALVMAIYGTLCLCVALAMNFIDRRVKLVER